MKRLMFILLLIGCKPSNLDFYSGPCLSGIDPFLNSTGNSVFYPEWIEENTLFVRGYVKAPCNQKIRGDYEVNNHNLTLKYIVKSWASCIDYYEVRYDIINISRKNYSISLIPVISGN